MAKNSDQQSMTETLTSQQKLDRNTEVLEVSTKNVNKSRISTNCSGDYSLLYDNVRSVEQHEREASYT